MNDDREHRKHAAELQKHMDECFSMRQCLGSISGKACGLPPIGSHTIAKRWLRSIARKSHVYSQSFDVFGKQRGANLGLSLVGINNATVYPIYCSQHDNELFRELEQSDFQPTTEKAAQLHFRAICREAFTKVGANVLMRTTQFDPRDRDFFEGLAGFALGNSAALRDATLHYHHERRRLREKRFDDLKYYACKFNGPLPFAFVGAFFPEIDFDGNQLADLTDLTRTPPALAVACFTDRGIGYCVMTWDNAGQDARQVAASFHRISETERADAALALGLEFIENVALSPDWWEALRDDLRESLLARLKTAGSPFSPIRRPDALVRRPVVLGPTPVQSWHSNDGLFSVLR